MDKKFLNKKVFVIVSIFLLIYFRNICCNVLTDIGSFISAMFKRPKIIGAVLPSSSFLATSITSHVQVSRPVQILEVGAGTGVFTEKIVEKMKEDDTLDVIEIEKDLCDILHEKFKDNKNVRIYCVSILDWVPKYKYDFIISGLPFNSFEYSFVNSILEKYRKIVKSGGVISYFEYLLTSAIRKVYSFLFLSKKEYVDFAKNIEVRENFRKRFEFDSDFVFLNVPPAYVYHMRVL